MNEMAKEHVKQKDHGQNLKEDSYSWARGN